MTRSMISAAASAMVLVGLSASAVAHDRVSQSGIYLNFYLPLDDGYYYEDDHHHHHHNYYPQRRPARKIQSGSLNYKLDDRQRFGEARRQLNNRRQDSSSRSWER